VSARPNPARKAALRDLSREGGSAMRQGPTGQRIRPGAAVVEFAFVALAFFTIILGIIEIGRGCMVTSLLTEAARRGCRQAVLEGTSSAAIQTAVVNYLNGVGINGENVSISVNDAPANTIDAQNMPAYTEITVTVSVPVSGCTWVPGGFLSGNLAGQYTMRRE
jgi:Flp pilus assembly protein TadG